MQLDTWCSWTQRSSVAGVMQLYMRASARLCRAAACQPTLRRPLAALAGAREHCTRTAVLPQAPVAALGRWQAPSGGGGGCRPGSALLPLQPRQLLHSTRCQAMAFTEADIAADVGVMVEGEPAGIRCACDQRKAPCLPATPDNWRRNALPNGTPNACPAPAVRRLWRRCVRLCTTTVSRC